MTKRIIHNLQEFTQELIDFISNGTGSAIRESKTGNDRKEDKKQPSLLDVMKDSKKEYGVEEYNLLVRLFYSVSRKMGDEFLDAINKLETDNDPIFRLQIIRGLLMKLHWDSTSSGTTLLTKLIQAVCERNGYEVETPKYLYDHIVSPLRDMLINTINAIESDHMSELEKSKARQQELDALLEQKRKELINVVLFENKERAGDFAKKKVNADKKVFCLDRPDHVKLNWHVHWKETSGERDMKALNQELSLLSEKIEIPRPAEHKDDKSARKKPPHNKIPPMFRNTRILINPQQIGHQKFFFTFVFSSKDNVRTIDWHDQQGKKHNVDPENYPELFSLLVKQVVNPKSVWGLTWYDMKGNGEVLHLNKELEALLAKQDSLASIDFSRELKIKTQCEKMLADYLDKLQVLINPDEEALKMASSTFVVYTSSDIKRIDWYDSLGKKHPVNLSHSPELAQWLEDNADQAKQDLSLLKTLLRYVSLHKEIDEKKQTSVQQVLQKKMGITLILADDVDKIPRYKRIPGTYILSREPGEPVGSWVLYCRQKGGVNETVRLADWGDFNDILASLGDSLPEKIDAKTREKLRATILSEQQASLQRQTNCIAIEQFDPEQASQYKAASFVVTQKDYEWQIYYIDTLHKAIPVDLQACAEAHHVIENLPETIADLLPDHFLELGAALKEYVPSSRIDINKYRDLERCFATRSQKPLPGKLNSDTEKMNIISTLEGFFAERAVKGKPDVSSQTTDAEKEVDEEKMVPLSGKLDLRNYAIATLFGHKPKQASAKKSVELADTDDNDAITENGQPLPANNHL
ncbi:hypothetical protein [Legionella spiritensis]|uniref:Uncharacterized protein n=1 Tax=Legionella spiritensis TaxID=452 RepID=A0A0W0YYX4_LEGSP|nr:hypothetical protein [Legionella spiritensis]KTD62043.1 hypothetical protein Lspi_1893 [Legionella spiritensis]SNV34533.1 Uncharacterised protein [Legionella spiritensis]